MTADILDIGTATWHAILAQPDAARTRRRKDGAETLYGVRVRTRQSDGRLVGEATDRYMLIQAVTDDACPVAVPPCVLDARVPAWAALMKALSSPLASRRRSTSATPRSPSRHGSAAPSPSSSGSSWDGDIAPDDCWRCGQHADPGFDGADRRLCLKCAIKDGAKS